MPLLDPNLLKNVSLFSHTHSVWREWEKGAFEEEGSHVLKVGAHVVEV